MGDDIGRVLTHSAEIVAVVVVVVMTCGRRVLVLLEVDFVFYVLTACTTTHEDSRYRNEDSETDQTNDGENSSDGSLVIEGAVREASKQQCRRDQDRKRSYPPFDDAPERAPVG